MQDPFIRVLFDPLIEHGHVAAVNSRHFCARKYFVLQFKGSGFYVFFGQKWNEIRFSAFVVIFPKRLLQQFEETFSSLNKIQWVISSLKNEFTNFVNIRLISVRQSWQMSKPQLWDVICGWLPSLRLRLQDHFLDFLMPNFPSVIWIVSELIDPIDSSACPLHLHLDNNSFLCNKTNIQTCSNESKNLRTFPVLVSLRRKDRYRHRTCWEMGLIWGPSWKTIVLYRQWLWDSSNSRSSCCISVAHHRKILKTLHGDIYWRSKRWQLDFS